MKTAKGPVCSNLIHFKATYKIIICIYQKPSLQSGKVLMFEISRNSQIVSIPHSLKLVTYGVSQLTQCSTEQQKDPRSIILHVKQIDSLQNSLKAYQTTCTLSLQKSHGRDYLDIIIQMCTVPSFQPFLTPPLLKGHSYPCTRTDHMTCFGQ